MTVWAAISAQSIIGPYFFEGTKDARLLLLRSGMWQWSFLYQTFSGFNTQTWFQEDGATIHTCITGMLVLSVNFSLIKWPLEEEIFPDYHVVRIWSQWPFLYRVIFKKLAINWCPEKNIRREMAGITERTCRAVINNFRRRLQECRNSNWFRCNFQKIILISTK